VAWITNLRGSDVSYNPVFLAHLLLTDGATLFVGAGKIDAALAAALAADGVHSRPTSRPAPRWRAAGRQHTLLLDPKRVTHGLRQRCAPGCRWSRPSTPARCCQEPQDAAEAAFVREAMAQDGAAMCEFYAWFEAALARGERITELTVDER
jgi:Xaa-Pro aminopeptidase